MTIRQQFPDPDTGNAGDETDFQSYAYIISQWMFNRLANDPFFENFVVKRVTSALPVEAWSQVPFLGVYLTEEPLAPPGGIWNQSTVCLSHSNTVGFQIILRNNTSDTLLRDLDRVKWYILRAILRDNDLTNRFNTGMAGGTGINGFSRGRIRQPRWGLTGSKNETPIGEQQIELTFQYETMWYPFGFPDLDRIDVTTGFPGPGSTPDERIQIEQVRMVYLFGPDGPAPNPLPPDTPPPNPPPGSP